MEAPLNRIVLEQEVPHPSRGLLREGGDFDLLSSVSPVVMN